MAWTYGEYIAEDLLEVTTDSTSTQYVSDLYITSETSTKDNRIKRIYANDEYNDATIVWDIWDYWLEAYDFDVPSVGGSVKSFIEVDSFGTDVEGYNNTLGFSVSPTSIGKNNNTYDMEHRIKVTQSGTGDYVYVTAYQAGKQAIDVVYGTPVVDETYMEQAPAGGGTVYLYVYWHQSKTILYDNDTTEEDDDVHGGPTLATVLTLGNKVVSECTIKNGGVDVPSAGSTTDSSSEKLCCSVTKYSFEANGKTVTKSGASIPVNREKNTYETEYYVWVGTPSPSSIGGGGGTFYVDAECSERKIFTSGYEGSWSASAAKVTYSNGASGVSSFSEETTLSVTVSENTTSSTRYPRVTVAASGDSSVSDYAEVTQSGVSFVFSADDLKPSVTYSATSVTLTGVSLRNGFAEEIAKGNVSIVSGYTISSPSISSVTTDLDGNFSIVITFSSNTSTSSKALQIKVTQPFSGKTLTYSITQGGKPEETNFIEWLDGSGIWIAGSRYTFSATLLYHKSLHGTNKTVSVTPLRGSTEITAAKTYSLNGSYYNTNYYKLDIEMLVQTYDTGDNFYLKAAYGNDTDTIELIESNDIL